MKAHLEAHRQGKARAPKKTKKFVWKGRCPVTFCDCNAKGLRRMKHIARAHPWLRSLSLEKAREVQLERERRADFGDRYIS